MRGVGVRGRSWSCWARGVPFVVFPFSFFHRMLCIECYVVLAWHRKDACPFDPIGLNSSLVDSAN